MSNPSFWQLAVQFNEISHVAFFLSVYLSRYDLVTKFIALYVPSTERKHKSLFLFAVFRSKGNSRTVSEINILFLDIFLVMHFDVANGKTIQFHVVSYESVSQENESSIFYQTFTRKFIDVVESFFLSYL